MEFEPCRLALEWCSPHAGRTVCAKGLCFSKQQRTGLLTSRLDSCNHIKSFPTRTTVFPYEEFWRGQHSPSCFIWKAPFMVLTRHGGWMAKNEGQVPTVWRDQEVSPQGGLLAAISVGLIPSWKIGKKRKAKGPTQEVYLLHLVAVTEQGST